MIKFVLLSLKLLLRNSALSHSDIVVDLLLFLWLRALTISYICYKTVVWTLSSGSKTGFSVSCEHRYSFFSDCLFLHSFYSHLLNYSTDTVYSHVLILLFYLSGVQYTFMITFLHLPLSLRSK